MKKYLSVFMVLSVLVLMLAACGGSAAPSSVPASEPAADSSVAPVSEAEPAEPEHEPATLNLAAAASLEDSFVSTLIPMFNEQYSWITVVGTYDASGKLQTQIEEGLEADVFFSAATKQMTALTESEMIDATTVVELLENELVLITAADSATTVSSFEDIANAGSIAIGDPESVPAGQYAQEALTSLGVWDSIQGVVSLGTNVTEVKNQVAEGSAEVGIVYATDAAQDPEGLKVLATAPEGSLETKVIYPVGILSAAPNREAAELFVEFLQSPEAMAVFTANGFKANA